MAGERSLHPWAASAATKQRVAERDRGQRRKALPLFAVYVGLLALRVATGSMSLTLLAVCVAFAIVIVIGVALWDPHRDFSSRTRESRFAYAGRALLTLDEIAQQPGLKNQQGTVSRHIARLGGVRGDLEVGAESVDWTPTPHARRKGYKPWTLAWSNVRGVELLSTASWLFPRRGVAVVHFNDGTTLTVRDIDLPRFYAGLQRLEAGTPGLVPVASSTSSAV